MKKYLLLLVMFIATIGYVAGLYGFFHNLNFIFHEITITPWLILRGIFPLAWGIMAPEIDQKALSEDLSYRIPRAIRNLQAIDLCNPPIYHTSRFSAAFVQVPRTETGTIHLLISSALHFQA